MRRRRPGGGSSRNRNRYPLLTEAQWLQLVSAEVERLHATGCRTVSQAVWNQQRNAALLPPALGLQERLNCTWQELFARLGKDHLLSERYYARPAAGAIDIDAPIEPGSRRRKAAAQDGAITLQGSSVRLVEERGIGAGGRVVILRRAYTTLR
jgi:hypothetical protein